MELYVKAMASAGYVERLQINPYPELEEPAKSAVLSCSSDIDSMLLFMVSQRIHSGITKDYFVTHGSELSASQKTCISQELQKNENKAVMLDSKIYRTGNQPPNIDHETRFSKLKVKPAPAASAVEPEGSLSTVADSQSHPRVGESTD
ncbi:MAG: hypothetical protein GY847_06560 [Proteobacteria bacterium]|nr:hypothetical protein [Pseudomonadota bacterium]